MPRSARRGVLALCLALLSPLAGAGEAASPTTLQVPAPPLGVATTLSESHAPLVLDFPAAAASASAVTAAPLVLPPTPQFRRFGMADGLPSSAINTLAQDRAGYIWFGGLGGLTRYDGVSFQKFIPTAASTSLATGMIKQLEPAPDGSLWVATSDTGVDRFDPRTQTFRHYRHDPKLAGSLSDDHVDALAVGPRGDVWAGTWAGLDHLAGQDARFEHLRLLEPFGIDTAERSGRINALHVEPDGTLWIGTIGGRVFRRASDGRVVPVPFDGAAAHNAILRIQGSGNDVRLDTRQGLFIVGADGRARRAVDAALLPPGYVFDSARDAAGHLWLATMKGVVLVDPGHGVTFLHGQPLLLGGMPGEWTWRILRDRDGGLWFGFYDGGAAYLAPGWEQFTRYTHVPDDPDSLRDTLANAVAPDGHGGLWVGARNTIDRLDPATGRAVHAISGLSSQILAMASLGRTLWFVTGKHQLFRCGPARCAFVDSALQLSYNMQTLPDGRLLAHSLVHGPVVIDPASNSYTVVPMNPAHTDPTDIDFMRLHRGRVVMGDSRGLLAWNAKAGRMDYVPAVAQGDVAIDMANTDDGLWLIRDDRVEHYRDAPGGQLRREQVIRESADANFTVVGMLADRRQRPLVLTTSGVWRFDPGSGDVEIFGNDGDFSDAEFNQLGVRLRPGGPMFAPTQGGVLAFRPDALHHLVYLPRPAIVAISKLGPHGTVELPPDSRVVRVDWNERELRVVARAFSYQDPKKQHYRFRLAGFDDGWVDVGASGERDFNALKPGDYRLDVEASGSGGRWGVLPVPLRIEVATPPWWRWWAWLAYALCALLLAGLVLLAWRRRLAQRHAMALAEQSRQLAEQASAAKTRFLAALSHEIRTPMTGVVGMAELLLATPLDTRQRDYAEAVQRSGTALLRLLNDALDLARIEAGRFELEPVPFSPRQLVDEVAALERGQAQLKGLAFDVQLDPRLPPWLLGDALRIRQVLLNLANNAIKFTGQGQVTLCADWSDGQLRLSVADTGPGIPEASQERLFQRFEQESGPQRQAGSGLGLAICRELVLLMDGSIEVESKLGNGSRFRVRLPLPLAQPEAAGAHLPSPGANLAGRALHLLLVEDDGIVAAVIAGLLAAQGHQVVHVVNGLAALAEFAEARFDAVLLDLDLPGIDGFQIARLLRQQAAGAELPIIAVTARSGGDEEARAREAGMDGFLRKPVSGAQLAAALAEVLVVAAAAD